MGQSSVLKKGLGWSKNALLEHFQHSSCLFSSENVATYLYSYTAWSPQFFIKLEYKTRV